MLKAGDVSDGVLMTLAFLAISGQANPPNVLLIEEPENGIYPKRLGEVIKLLKELVQEMHLHQDLLQEE
jgi:predicted ATPase